MSGSAPDLHTQHFRSVCLPRYNFYPQFFLPISYQILETLDYAANAAHWGSVLGGSDRYDRREQLHRHDVSISRVAHPTAILSRDNTVPMTASKFCLDYLTKGRGSFKICKCDSLVVHNSVVCKINDRIESCQSPSS